MSLFFDILLCLTLDITEEDYVSGSFKTHTDCASAKLLHHGAELTQQRARAILWKTLRGLKMKAGYHTLSAHCAERLISLHSLLVRLPQVEHQYLRFVASGVLDRYKNEREDPCVINSIVPEGTTIGDNSLLINCHLKVL